MVDMANQTPVKNRKSLKGRKSLGEEAQELGAPTPKKQKNENKPGSPQKTPAKAGNVQKTPSKVGSVQKAHGKANIQITPGKNGNAEHTPAKPINVQNTPGKSANKQKTPGKFGNKQQPNTPASHGTPAVKNNQPIAPSTGGKANKRKSVVELSPQAGKQERSIKVEKLEKFTGTSNLNTSPEKKGNVSISAGKESKPKNKFAVKKEKIAKANEKDNANKPELSLEEKLALKKRKRNERSKLKRKEKRVQFREVQQTLEKGGKIDQAMLEKIVQYIAKLEALPEKSQTAGKKLVFYKRLRQMALGKVTVEKPKGKETKQIQQNIKQEQQTNKKQQKTKPQLAVKKEQFKVKKEVESEEEEVEDEEVSEEEAEDDESASEEEVEDEENSVEEEDEVDSEEEEEDEEDSSDYDAETNIKVDKVTKKMNTSIEESEDDEEEEDDDDEDDAEVDDEDDEDEDESEDDEEGSEDEEESEEEVGFIAKKQKTNNKPQEDAPKKKRFVVFVGNLPYDATKEDIVKHFKKVGPIKDVRIPPTKDGKKSQGFAYLELTNNESYEKAISLHHTMLNGRRINVQYTTGGKKQGEEKMKEIKQKNFKLHAMRKQGKLAGSVKESQKRAARRAIRAKANKQR